MSLAACLRSEQPRQIFETALSPVNVDWNMRFEREPVKSAFEYWTSLCNGRSMPRRRELSPYRMRAFLPHVNLVQVIRECLAGPTDYIMTLEGQHAHEIYGAVAHRKLHEALPPALEERWRRGFGLALEVARPVRFFSTVHVGGEPRLQGEVLVAPLGDEIAGVEALFVVFAAWQVSADAAREQFADG
jgi:hypothetical protein